MMILLEEEKRELISTLKQKGIEDDDLLKAFNNVPRERFISEALRKFAYTDNALPIDCEQTISQPFTVAYMTKALDIKPGDKVLEIGTGSGYQCAILCELGADVYTIERIEKLHESAKALLEELNYNVHMKLDDGTHGWPENAPYNKIIVTAGAPDVPHSLVDQLKIDGRIVIPVGSRKSQKLYVITRTEEGVEYKVFENFKFVPLIGDEGWKE
jgi:protein-L-isoaspartate(D-aspartate) O-methyltransferase